MNPDHIMNAWSLVQLVILHRDTAAGRQQQLSSTEDNNIDSDQELTGDEMLDQLPLGLKICVVVAEQQKLTLPVGVYKIQLDSLSRQEQLFLSGFTASKSPRVNNKLLRLNAEGK